MPIPFYSDLLFPTLFFPLGIGILALAINEWRKAWRQHRRAASTATLMAPPDEESPSRMLLILPPIAGIAFSLLGASSLFIGIPQIYRFRHIDISTVVGLRVYRTSAVPESAAEIRLLENAEKVRAGLRLLESCTSTSLNHEHFVDGYHMQIIFEDSTVTDYYLSAYKRTNIDDRKTGVVPHVSRYGGLNIGYYNCPAYQNWIVENIDPLFSASQSDPAN